MPAPSWTALIPVKPLPRAKSRLRGAVPGVAHERLVAALALDTIAAVRACPDIGRIYLICDDPHLTGPAATLGAISLPDLPAAGLNAALRYAAEHARREQAATEPTPGDRATTEPTPGDRATTEPTPGDRATTEPTPGDRATTEPTPGDRATTEPTPGDRATTEPTPGEQAGGGGLAALAADLPALRPAELTAALRRAGGRRAFLADAAGTGTTLLVAGAGEALDPRFGAGSAAAHARSGALRLDGDWPSLRRDVDTAADLAAAWRLGLGPRTRQVVRATDPARLIPMQGTVASFDPHTRTGTLLLDDGSELALPAPAFDSSGLRLLRLGQRLRIEKDDSGEVSRVTLPTFP